MKDIRIKYPRIALIAVLLLIIFYFFVFPILHWMIFLITTSGGSRGYLGGYEEQNPFFYDDKSDERAVVRPSFVAERAQQVYERAPKRPGYFRNQKSQANDPNQLNKQPRMRMHVFYVHYMDTKDKLTIDNFIFFMNFAYSACNPRVFFTIVLNRRNMDTNLMSDLEKVLGASILTLIKNCTYNELDLSDRKQRGHRNTKIIVRLNDHGGDLCANVDMLKSEFFKKNEHLFFYYFFINSSVRGPFLPNYYLRPWWDMFIDMFEAHDNTVAVGPYMSCEGSPHIQSFLIVVDRRGLQFMKEVWRCPRLDEIESKRMLWIYDTEVKLSTVILRNGFEIRSFISLYNGLGTLVQFKDTKCLGDNPSVNYPVSDSLVANGNSYNTNSKHLDFYITYLKTFCNDQFIKNEQYSVNVFEVVWVKYGGSINEVLMNNYIRKYVPLYTELMYKAGNEQSTSPWFSEVVNIC